MVMQRTWRMIPLHRASYDGVFSRSFAAPSVTAECAAAFLCPGGALVVSEPPEPVEGRWPTEHVQSLRLIRCLSD